MEIVRKATDAVNAFMRGELSSEGLTEFADEQFEFRWYDDRTLPDLPQHLQGTPAGIGMIEQLRSAWADLTWEPLEFIEAPDDRVVTALRLSGRGREGGVPLVVHYFQVWTIRDEKVRKGEIFRHRADALEAAGLSE